MPALAAIVKTATKGTLENSARTSTLQVTVAQEPPGANVASHRRLSPAPRYQR